MPCSSSDEFEAAALIFTDHETTDTIIADENKTNKFDRRRAQKKKCQRILIVLLLLISAGLAAISKEDDEYGNTAERYLAVAAQNVPILGHLMCIGYALNGNHKEAQRAAGRATFGAIGAVFEFINEYSRYKSPRLTLSVFADKPEHTAHAQWMGRYGNSSLNELWIPGSHESATYSIPDSIVHAWAICQTYTVSQQLMAGIRYLDFRVITVENEVYIAHRFQGGEFRTFLREIRSFLVKYPTEVVIIRVDHNVAGGDCDKKVVNELMKEILNGFIVRKNEFEMQWPTIFELTQNGTKGRVLLLSPGTALDFGALNAKAFSYKTSWDDYHCQYPRKWYANYKRFLTEFEENPEYVGKDFVLMAGELTGEANVIGQSVVGQITRGIGKWISSLFVEQQFVELRDMSLSCNYQLKRLLTRESQLFASKKAMIVTHDYIDTELIDLIVHKNV